MHKTVAFVLHTAKWRVALHLAQKVALEHIAKVTDKGQLAICSANNSPYKQVTIVNISHSKTVTFSKNADE